MWVYRIAWHDGFNGTHTAETSEPRAFMHGRHCDWWEIYGCYRRIT